jgi:hypothetical protein
MPNDPYQYLIDMHGMSHSAGPEGHGFACRFRAEQKHEKVSYAVVLCDRYGKRLLGFDNSHGYDHEHPPRKGKPYTYTTAENLVADFYKRVAAYFSDD